MSSFIIILVGVSGAGKTTLKNFACKAKNLQHMLSVTDRPKRKSEKHKKDKFFVTSNQFIELMQKQKLSFTQKVFDNNYGFFSECFTNGKNYICEIYYENISDFKKFHKHCAVIYVKPCDIQLAIKGVQNRGAKEKEILTRLQTITGENLILENLEKNHFFDFTFINHYDKNIKKEFYNLIQQIIENKDKYE